MKKITLVLAVILFSTFGAFAQLEDPVSWSYGYKKISATEGIVLVKASLEEGWHIYSQTVKPGGPNKTVFKFAQSKDYVLVGTPTEPKPISKYEKVFGMNVPYFENQVVFQQRVKLKKPTTVVKGTVEFMVCNDTSCLPPKDVSFSVPVK